MNGRNIAALLVAASAAVALLLGTPAHAATPITPLSISLTADGVKIACKRKGGGTKTKPFLRFTFTTVFTTKAESTPPQRVTINVKLTGADAEIGSLLYPVVFLGNGAGAIDALHGQGYDVAVEDLGSTVCQDVLPAPTCSSLATQLAKAIGAVLAIGDTAELTPFLDGVSNLGYPTCPVT